MMPCVILIYDNQHKFILPSGGKCLAYNNNLRIGDGFLRGNWNLLPEGSLKMVCYFYKIPLVYLLSLNMFILNQSVSL